MNEKYSKILQEKKLLAHSVLRGTERVLSKLGKLMISSYLTLTHSQHVIYRSSVQGILTNVPEDVRAMFHSNAKQMWVRQPHSSPNAELQTLSPRNGITCCWLFSFQELSHNHSSPLKSVPSNPWPLQQPVWEDDCGKSNIHQLWSVTASGYVC